MNKSTKLKKLILPLVIIVALIGVFTKEIYSLFAGPKIDAAKLEQVKQNKKELSLILIPKIDLGSEAFIWVPEGRKYQIEHYTTNQAVIEILEYRDDIIPIIQAYAEVKGTIANVILLWHWNPYWISIYSAEWFDPRNDLTVEFIQKEFPELQWIVKHFTVSACRAAQWEFVRTLSDVTNATAQWTSFDIINAGYPREESPIIMEYPGWQIAYDKKKFTISVLVKEEPALVARWVSTDLYVKYLYVDTIPEGYVKFIWYPQN